MARSKPSDPRTLIFPDTPDSPPLELERGPRHGDLITITFSGLSPKGEGQAHFTALVGPQKSEKSYCVTTRDVLPGERALVEVRRFKKGQIDAALSERLTTHPERVSEPACPHFGPREEANKGCGGCTLQHLPYDAQLKLKQQLVEKTLESVDGIEGLIAPILPCDTPYHYRNKMEFSFGDNPHHAFAIGLHPAGFRYDVLSLESCHLFSDWVAGFLPMFSDWCRERGLEFYNFNKNTGFLRQLMMREGKHTGERLVELMTSSSPTAMCDGEQQPSEDVARKIGEELLRLSELGGFPITTLYWTQHHVKKGERSRQIELVLHGSGVYAEELHVAGADPLRFDVHPRAFFQPNTLQAQKLYERVLQAAGLIGEDVGETTPRHVLDLYCGTGTIGLCMASHAEHVLGIELNADAVENAKKNAERNGLKNITFFAGDVSDVLGEERFTSLSAERPIDLVVVDPPRAGLMPGAMQHIRTIDAPRLVYVSCNPKALARDLQILTEQAGYRLVSVQPVDMFPQTLHVENVALLVK